MISPISSLGPIAGPLTVNPAALRQAGGAAIPPAAEPGERPRTAAEAAADTRRVQPPPRIDGLRPKPPPRGDRADTADGGTDPRGAGRSRSEDVAARAAGFRARAERFDPSNFGEIRAGRVRPRPSAAFLAQAIGQEPGAGAGGGPSARTVAGLYRQTRETVDRALFRGLTRPSDPEPGRG